MNFGGSLSYEHAKTLSSYELNALNEALDEHRKAEAEAIKRAQANN